MIAAVVVLAAAAFVQGEATNPTDLQAAASRLMLATVADPQGRPLIDLGPDDFAVAENGREREILAVYAADYPVVVLLDNGAGATGDMEAIRRAIGRFISRLGPRAVAIGTLADPPALIASFDDDRVTALAKLEKVSVNPSSTLAPIQAISNAAGLIAESGTPFSAVVVVTARPIEAAEPETAGLPRTIFDSGAFVHVVARRPVTAPGGPGGIDADLLRDLTKQTHGQYTGVFSAASYSVALDRLIERLAAEVMIEYLVPPGSQNAGEVRVGVKLPGARVRGLGVSK